MNFSVIIPCHNAEEWIADTIRSVMKQTLPPKQIILVDDSSNDNSVKNALSIGIPVDVVSVKRYNAAAARNDGISAANEKWVAFLDADDEWLPDHLERVSKLLHPTDIAYLATSLYRYAGNRSQVIEFPWPAPWPSMAQSGLNRWDFLNWFSASTHFNHSSLVVSLDALRAIGGYDDNLRRRHDYELFMRIICQGTWTYDPNPASIVQLNTPKSISSFTAECNYYYLIGLKKNYIEFKSKKMDYLLHRQARSAIRSVLIIGNTKDIKKTWDVSRNLFTPAEKTVYSLLRLFPLVSRYLYKFIDWLKLISGFKIRMCELTNNPDNR